MKLKNSDQELYKILNAEKARQKSQLQMIPSENYASKAVREALASVVVNKYSEGQPNKRYYQGNQHIDELELLAKHRALKLFNLDPEEWSVNVQAANGSVANLAVYMALLEPGDKLLSMFLYDGGHLSHGWRLPSGKTVSMTSKLFSPNYYSVNPKTMKFDYKEIATQAKQIHPKIIISGGTAYPREVNYKEMGRIAKEVGAYYLADVAHEAGLIAAGTNKSPFKHADVVTMTTRKTLRGPIGALVFSKKELSSQIDRAVFPGLQGGPPNHQIAGITAALGEALKPEFKTYANNVVENCKYLARELAKHDFEIVSGGTDKHLLLIDLRTKGIDGWCAAWALDAAGIITNRSTIPYDTGSPYYPSGLRLGTPAITTRGMGKNEMKKIALWINQAIKEGKTMVSDDFTSKDKKTRILARKEYKSQIFKNTALNKISKEVKKMCSDFPIE